MTRYLQPHWGNAKGGTLATRQLPSNSLTSADYRKHIKIINNRPCVDRAWLSGVFARDLAALAASLAQEKVTPLETLRNIFDIYRHVRRTRLNLKVQDSLAALMDKFDADLLQGRQTVEKDPELRREDLQCVVDVFHGDIQATWDAYETEYRAL